jgi:hypothetical protein
LSIFSWDFWILIWLLSRLLVCMPHLLQLSGDSIRVLGLHYEVLILMDISRKLTWRLVLTLVYSACLWLLDGKWVL